MGFLPQCHRPAAIGQVEFGRGVECAIEAPGLVVAAPGIVALAQFLVKVGGVAQGVRLRDDMAALVVEPLCRLNVQRQRATPITFAASPVSLVDQRVSSGSRHVRA